MTKQSALLHLYRAKGATLVKHGQWLLPAHFGNPLGEYYAVRHRVGLLDLCQRSFLRFTGDARTSFVNSMVSNDVNSLSVGQGLHAAFLDLQGKVLADARIFCATNSLLVDIPECRKEPMLQYLKRHPTADDVEIRDLSGEYSMLSVQGPNADWLIADAVLSDGLPLVDLVHRQVTIAATTVTLIQATHASKRAYDLLIPMAALPDVVSRIEEVGKHWSLSWVGVEAQEMLRIEAGVPLYGIDVTEETFLWETGQEQWVSFNKRFAGLIVQTKQTIEKGARIYDGEREVGSITSCSFSPQTDTAVAVGYLQRDHLIPGTHVTIREGRKTFAAVVSLLPIYQPASIRNHPS